MKLFAAAVFACALQAQDLPAKPGLYAIFETSEGNIVARLYEKETPIAVSTFVGLAQGTHPWKDPKTGALVKRPLYENLVFHRVLPGMMIQSGDPSGTGAWGCGFKIPDEFLPGLRFDQAGKLAIANTGDPNSGSCQFFITVDTVVTWTNKYTIFGNVVSGLDVAEKISKAKVKGDKPVAPAHLLHVRIERVGPPPKGKK